MKNKILIELIVPEIDEKYNIYIPINKKVGNVIVLLEKAVKDNIDVILIDTNHMLSDHNLISFDSSDYILYMLSNDTLDIKNMKTMLSIFRDMDMDNYRVILNNSIIRNKDYFNEYDIKNIIKNKIDFVIPSSLYDRHVDKYILNGEIMTLNKSYVKKHKKEIDSYKSFLDVLLKKKV